MKPPRITAMVRRGSLARLARRLADNWRLGRAVQMDLRAKYKADGEWSMWATSYVIAPLWWGLAVTFAIDATIHNKPESPSAEASQPTRDR